MPYGQEGMVLSNLDPHGHQGWFGECFVQALAAAVDLDATPPRRDRAGIDFEISSIDDEGETRYPSIKVQVKSWSTPATTRDGTGWNYRGLTERQFNRLAGHHQVPRYLFLVVVPRAAKLYAYGDVDQLTLRNAAYWASLADQDKIEQPSKERRVPVVVPKSNLLTPESLLTLVRTATLEVGS